jgi:predicted aldo/keto reductase-like oxidoreductase
MENIKKQGKARFIGIATHKFEDEAIRAAADTKIYDIILTAYNFRKKNAAEIKDAIAYAAGAGLGIIAMKTMAGAYWDKEKTKPINTKAALKWVLQDENVHTTVPGLTTFDQLKQNIELMNDLRLTEEEKQSLQPVTTCLPTGVYCHQCGECIPQCPNSLDIPTIMRSYMYAYGYKNLSHAQQTLSMANLDQLPCNDCNTCNVQCVMGNDVKTKITDIARLNSVPKEFLIG